MNRWIPRRGVVIGLVLGLLIAVPSAGCVDLTRPSFNGGGGGDGPTGGFAGDGASSGGSGGQAVRDGATELEERLSMGQACESSDQCATDHCVDGVCCDTLCDGPCESCGTVGNEGVCRLFEAGTDPKNACPDDGAASCGRDGACDSTGACRYYAATIVCKALACDGSTMTEARCNGQGVCMPATSGSCYPYTCASPASCRTTCATTADCVTPSACFTGTCGGLTATYFDNGTLTGRSVTRVERNIDHLWEEAAPVATIDSESWSARWTGRLTPPVTDTYTFYAVSDDGIRVWIDDKLVLDDWRVHGVAEIRSGPVSLEKGKPVSIKVEYFDDELWAECHLSWSSTQRARQIIPVSALSP